MRRATIISLFVVAVLLVWTGLYVGLQVNPDLGTTVVLAGVAVAVVTGVWLLRSKQRQIWHREHNHHSIAGDSSNHRARTLCRHR